MPPFGAACRAAPQAPGCGFRRHRPAAARGRMCLAHERWWHGLERTMDIPTGRSLDALGTAPPNWRPSRRPASRTALGWESASADRRGRTGRRRRSEQRTTAEHFRVLGELKGGAMKFGQALSVFEAAIPAGAGRAVPGDADQTPGSAAPPMPSQSVHRVLAERPGHRTGATASSSSPTNLRRPPVIGQVHQAIWHDGREVAVKDAVSGRWQGAALRLPAAQQVRPAVLRADRPGLEVKPLLERVARPDGGGARLPSSRPRASRPSRRVRVATPTSPSPRS